MARQIMLALVLLALLMCCSSGSAQPQEGTAQQLAVANYLSRAIPALASGAPGKPGESSPALASTVPGSLPATTPNSEALSVRNSAQECPANLPNPVVSNACLGIFHHGTPVKKIETGELVLATPTTATNTHVGVDLIELDENGSAKCGGAIFPFADGEVVDLISDPKDVDFQHLGYMVMLRHQSPSDLPTYTLYLHMNGPPKVTLHQRVSAGTSAGSQLGNIGSTPKANASCHLHFEIRHFPTRYLEDCAWNFPSNIYGKGYLEGSAVFRENWEDPVVVFATGNRLPNRPTQGRQVVIADFLSPDGHNFFLAPFLLYKDGAYTPLPDGTSSNATGQLSDQDYLPKGSVNPDPNSPKVVAARTQSILNEVKEFNLYQNGQRVGCFSVKQPTVAGVGSAGGPVVVASNVSREGGKVAAAGPTRHDGFWSSKALSSAEQKRLLSKAMGALPKTVPVVPKDRIPADMDMSRLTGKPLIFGTKRVISYALDLNLDGKREAFFSLDVDLSTSLGPFAGGYVSMLESYEPATDSWKTILSCAAIVYGSQFFWGESTCNLMDVVDINGDGVAEVILRRGYGDIEVYEVKGGRLRLVSAIRGWTGS